MKLASLAEALGAELIGDPETEIQGLATLASAHAHSVSFFVNAKYADSLRSTNAAAVIVKRDQVDNNPAASLIVDDPYFAFAQASALFDRSPVVVRGIHPQAMVDESAVVDPTAAIAPGAVVEADVEIAAGASVGPGCVVMRGARLGKDSRLVANVTIYHDVRIGERTTIHGNCVIGGDGFGYAPKGGRWHKIYQLGSVQIGNDVEIGAGTTIDRGALDDTIIGDGVIIDNLVMIAHNVEIGDYTAMAGGVGVAGSTKIGKNCTLGGRANIIGHIDVPDGTHITACAFIHKKITEAGSYSSGAPMETTASWRKNAARMTQLDKMARRITELEKRLAELDSK